MVASSQSDLSCFTEGGQDVAIAELSERLSAHKRLSMKDAE